MSAEACGAKMDAHRDESLAGAGQAGLDFVPIIGDIKSFKEAKTKLDYLVAMVGFAGKAIKAVATALKKGDLAEALRLINESSQQISAKAKDTQIWTETKKKEPVPNAYGHWDKNKQEFPEFQNPKQYVEATHSFINNPPVGT
ncbi:hypothetical protein N3553_05655 [Pantoea dispersa]|jgi:hypothetical protein|nr:hypothetical protein [Pantoea dispersa]MCT6589357.1 hypothetical protein [Pantoea dispersa]